MVTGLGSELMSFWLPSWYSLHDGMLCHSPDKIQEHSVPFVLGACSPSHLPRDQRPHKGTLSKRCQGQATPWTEINTPLLYGPVCCFWIIWKVITSAYSAKSPKPRNTKARRGTWSRQGTVGTALYQGREGTVGRGSLCSHLQELYSMSNGFCLWNKYPLLLTILQWTMDILLGFTKHFLCSSSTLFPAATTFCTFSGTLQQPPHRYLSHLSHHPPSYLTQHLTESSQKYRFDAHFPN